MKAMLLTAGLGERMYPLTERLPKPALPVLGRPILLQLLHWLARFEPEHVVLNLHHLPEVLIDLLADREAAGLPPVRVSHESTLLGTAGGIRRAETWLDGEAVVVCNGDFLSDIDLRGVIEAHRRARLPATLVLTEPRPGYSEVQVDDEGRVLSLAGSPPAPAGRVARRCLFTGCQVISREIFRRIPRSGPSDLVRDVYRPLAQEGRLGSVWHDGFWWEFGSPRPYLEGSLELLCRSVEAGRRLTNHDPPRRLGDAIAAVGPGVTCHARARVRGRAALGFAARVEEGAEIEDTIVMPEAWIGPDCRLRRVVVGRGVELPRGTALADVLVGSAAPDSTPRIADARRLGDLVLRPIPTAD